MNKIGWFTRHFKPFRKAYGGSMIRPPLPDRIICIVNTYRGDLNRIILSLFPFFAGILSSYLSGGGTFTSYFLPFLAAVLIQEDITRFLAAGEGAEPSPEPLKESGLGVALYARVSTDRQAERGFSIQDQKERLKAEAERLKASRVFEVVDAGESGTDFGRKGLSEVLDLAKEGKIQLVLVTSLDRIGRDLIESLDYVRKLRGLGVKIMAAGSEADIDTEEGLMIATVQFLSAELENRRRTRSSIAGRIQSFKSKHWGRPIPLGYRKRGDGWIEIELGWSAVIGDLFDAFRRTGSYHSAMDIVNKRHQGVLARQLTRHQAKQILQNPVYMGKPRYGDKVSIEDPSLAYVSLETFQAVQEISERIRSRYTRDRRDALEEFVREFGLEILDFIPKIAVLCPDCPQSVMVRNGTTIVGGMKYHNYLCKNCGRQRKVPTKRQMRRIQELASKQEKLFQGGGESLNIK